MSATLYQPLTDWQTRILELQPGNLGQPLEGVLHTVDLIEDEGVQISSNQKRTYYDAVSYCWGSGTPSKRIRLLQWSHPISTNLFEGLQRMRSRRRILYLWIDSICICQSDVAERSKQVPLMLEIYRKARQVIAWLGEQDLYGHLVESEYRRLPKKLRKHIRPGNPLLLATRPWASRIWVRQKVWAARDILLRWHDCSMYWDDVFGEYEDLLGLHRPTQAERRQKMLGDPPRNILSNRYFSLDILAVLNRCVGCECSDPRDHVYGVLGMSTVTSEADQDLYSCDPALRVDYERSVAQVFQDVAEYIIKRDGDLAILSLHAAFGGYIRGSRSVLPSWVPDWRHRTSRPPEIIADESGIASYAFDVHDPSSRMQWLYSDIHGGLRVRAWHLETISSVSSSDTMVPKVKYMGIAL